MSEQNTQVKAVRQNDILLAIGALEVVIEKGVEKNIPMNEDKLALSRLKAAFGITV